MIADNSQKSETVNPDEEHQNNGALLHLLLGEKIREVFRRTATFYGTVVGPGQNYVPPVPPEIVLQTLRLARERSADSGLLIWKKYGSFIFAHQPVKFFLTLIGLY